MQREMCQQMLRQEQVRSQEVRSEKMRTQVRTQELMGLDRNRRSLSTKGMAQNASLRLLEIYAELALRGEHLLGQLLGGELPRQWRHYPEDDAIDLGSGFQWFYHSHSPQDRS
jgi:hypothetical protein